MDHATLYLRQPGPGALEDLIESLKSNFDERGGGESRGWVAFTDGGEPIAITMVFGDHYDGVDDSEEL